MHSLYPDRSDWSIGAERPIDLAGKKGTSTKQNTISIRPERPSFPSQIGSNKKEREIRCACQIPKHTCCSVMNMKVSGVLASMLAAVFALDSPALESAFQSGVKSNATSKESSLSKLEAFLFLRRTEREVHPCQDVS